MDLIVVCSKLFGLALVIIIAAYVLFLLPPKHPENIPAIPFWVVLLPFFYDIDQETIFKKYLKTPLHEHGAVKIFFGAQWNILVQRPDLVNQVLKNEDLYQKSGNQKKIPHSVLAQFLGDNIISAHGDVWKQYQKIIKPGLQRQFDTEPISKNAAKLSELIRTAQLENGSRKGIPVQHLLQRYTIANAAQNLHQTDFETLQREESRLDRLQMAVKMQIFKPIFMNFPFLDRFPFPSRKKARDLVRDFSDELQQTIRRSHVHDGKPCSLDSDSLGCRLIAAHEAGLLTDQQVRDNINVTFVAGQENPQLALISTMYLLGKHQDIQKQLRASLASGPLDGTDSEESPLLTSVLLESLRLFPPIGQLINRKVHGAALLENGEVPLYVPDGTYVGYNCYATNRDARVWADADAFVPSRWGNTADEIAKRYRRAKGKAQFITFHGGRRACLGERFALLQLRVTVRMLLRDWEWELDPSWPERMTPAGPLYPRQLRLIFHSLVKPSR